MSYLVTLLTTTKGIGIDEGLEPLTENFLAWSKANRKVTCYCNQLPLYYSAL